MPTRYHGKAGVPKVSLGNANGLASQILTHWEQISPKRTTSDAWNQADKGERGKQTFVFPGVQ